MPITFIPFERIDNRLLSSKEDSDLAYFYDLILYGEFLTKIISLFLVSAINEDKERTKYRHEHFLARANAIGDFSKTIDEVVTGPSAQILTSLIRDFELRELTQRVSSGDWQYQTQKLIVDCLEIFKIDHNDLPAKSPLRSWFHYFTLLRNKTRGHGATRTEPCSKACPKLEESIKLLCDNFTAFKRPWAYLYKNLSGKYRVSSLNGDNSDFEYLKRNTNSNFESGVYCYLDQPRKINLLFSNPELTDFFITNGNLKDKNYETISYITDERVMQNANDYLNPITVLPSSHTEGNNELEVIGNCFTNLPQAPDEYIKRPHLELELKKVLLEKERFPIVTLLGKGGVGKTSLSINVIKEIAKTERFDLIIWFSARDIDLLMEGPKQVKTKVLNQKDIASDYCQLVYPKIEIKDKTTFFSNQLNKNDYGNALYIFDNFETVTNPIEIFEWLNTFIRNPNKILITSRISRSFKADYPIEVQGMTDSECRELIQLFSQKFGITDLLSSSYINEIIEESDGHPYIIKILLGEVAKTGKTHKIQRIVAEQEKILTALFKRTFNTLTPAAKRVFLTLCSWNSMIPVIAVEAVLWRPENEKIDVQGALDELSKSSFIDIINEGKEAMINVPLAASIFGKSELEVYPAKFKIIDDRNLLMEFGTTNQTNISSGVSQKIERKFKAVATRIKSLVDFQKELPALEYLASKFPKAWTYIIELFEEYEDYDNVKYFLREYLKSSLPADEKAKQWLKLANICRFTKDWEGESHALSELVIINGVPFDLISDAANRINNYFYFHPEAKDIDYKKVLLEKIIDVMKKRISEANATDYSRLGWLLLNNNDETDAKVYVEKGLDLDYNNHHCQKLYNRLNGF
ncbi:MAG: NB-ARC domain-containing protein [Ginsengibacter sp.]